LNNLGQIKLGDFGISKNLETIKMASTFIGSLDYLAPEIINGQNYSFEADIWSLGVTFYELMTFKKPFIGNFPGIYLKIVNDKFEPINDDLYSKDFRNLVYQMLNKDPKKRPKPKDIIGMNFVRNRMLSYLQEKKFNLKDSFNLIQDYQRKKKTKIL
jgi:serine/threonine protein kinase